MTAYTDFHYSPTGSGVISGSQVLEQTEQGINGLGQYVQDNISGAIDTANQALTIAQTANTNATTALNTANSFSDAITTANQTANNALTTAQSAQSTANIASSLATTANNNATSALNAANAATSNVNTLTSTVNGLGNRMTAAENAISANAGNITTLQNNLATTNANVTAAANAASAAQATATSAQSTATLARNQAYVLRYTGTTITGGGTIAYADIDNTDNIKAGDKIIDISGAIYAIASVDIANETVTVGASPVINLFCDAENLIPAANNSYDLGSSSYQWNNLYAKSYYYNGTAWGVDKANVWTRDNTFKGNIYQNQGDINYIIPRGTSTVKGDLTTSGSFSLMFKDKNNGNLTTSGIGYLTLGQNSSGSYANIGVDTIGSTDNARHANSISLKIDPTTNDNTAQFYPVNNNATDLGTSTNKWATLNGVNPGALSLPSSDSADYIDLSSNLSTNAEYQYTAPSDGWLCLYILVNGFYQENAVGLYRSDTSANSHQWAKSVTAAINLYKQNRYQGSVMLPVESGKKYICYLSLNANTTIHNKYLFFYKNKGNV